MHRYGGRPVGAFLRAAARPARARVAHALLLDLTHDNPSPVERRCALDLLPTAALVAMACCATGSTRGYDELVPHHVSRAPAPPHPPRRASLTRPRPQVHVVDEERLYCEWGEGEGRVGAAAGMLAARRALNRLHVELARAGYSEVFVDQMDADTVAVTRHEPHSRKVSVSPASRGGLRPAAGLTRPSRPQSVILVAATAFRAPDAAAERRLRPLRFEGQLEEILLEAALQRG